MKIELSNFYFLLSISLFSSYLSKAQTPVLKANSEAIEIAKKKYPDLFDSTKLSQHEKINELLKKEGFQEGYFTTSDGIKINYNRLERKNATKWVILCTGWFPGRKEGIATLFAILPENYNLLFFDARGHGKSQGPMLSNIWHYGKSEYKDILGAIKQAHEINSLPIVLYGTCAGAFHAAHALAHLEKEKKIAYYDIRGLIFDSGWAQVDEVAYTTPKSTLEDMLIKKIAAFKGLGKDKQAAKKSLLFKALNPVIKTANFIINRLFFNPFFKINYPTTNLYNKIGTISIPIFFIHSLNDSCAPIASVKYLALLAQKPSHWWIKESKHACHFLKFSDEYRERIIEFCEDTN